MSDGLPNLSKAPRPESYDTPRTIDASDITDEWPDEGYIQLLEIPCTDCGTEFYLDAPDVEHETKVSHTIECPDCGWSKTVEMEIIKQ